MAVSDVAPPSAGVLSEPLVLSRSRKAVPSRFLKSAMTERLCTFAPSDPSQHGRPTAAYQRLYEEWSRSGLGVIVLGNIPVHQRHLEAPGNAIIDQDLSWDPVQAFRPVVAAAKSRGSLVIAQLTHGGRQVPESVNMHPVSASDIACPSNGIQKYAKPTPMTKEQIHDFQDRMAYAAGVMYQAGADGVQLHGAHGYLLSQFLSPRVNRRTDEYGGSFENRSRIIFETISRVRQAVPDTNFIICMKINSSDFIDDGFSPEDSQLLAIGLESAGLEFLELSGGTYESRAFQHSSESSAKREAYFIELAEQLKPHLHNMPVCVTGGFRSLAAMEKAVKEGTCDLVGLARPLTAEPYLPKELLAGVKSAAKKNLIEPSKQTAAAIQQISDLAHGRPIFDTSSESSIEALDRLIKQI